ncbi:glutathionylspermidine synthase family protein [Escherichia coli]
MDFAWCGNAPVKLLEADADTPTSLYESADSQRLWAWRMPGAAALFRYADQAECHLRNA